MVYYNVTSYNEDMFLVGILSWWYGDGWRQRLNLLGARIDRINDFFSVGLLARTLFSPFRQISAGVVSGPIGVQARALVDQLISRMIGFFVRGFMILLGIVVMILVAVWGIVLVIGWAIIPLFPIIGLVMVAIGWVPSWR